MQKLQDFVLAAAAAAIWFSSSAARADIVSDFSINDEGWTAFQNVGAPVQYFAAGGNPGGYISVRDYTADWAYLEAPAKFLVPAAYGGSLSFDLKIFNSHPAQFPNIYSVRAGLQGAGLTLINEGTLPTTSWANYSFTLDELSGWRKFSDLSQNYSASAPIVTQVEMQSVLANLSRVVIATDYSNADLADTPNIFDDTHIDNVRLTTPIPEPSTLGLFALAALTCSLAGRAQPRNRRSIPRPPCHDTLRGIENGGTYCLSF